MTDWINFFLFSGLICWLAYRIDVLNNELTELREELQRLETK